jgi:hypothetical protein
VVFATGDHTVFGKIAKASTSIDRPDTLLKRSISYFIHVMAAIALLLGIVFGALSLNNGYTWVQGTSLTVVFALHRWTFLLQRKKFSYPLSCDMFFQFNVRQQLCSLSALWLLTFPRACFRRLPLLWR